jgi:hypothetical protein
MEMKKLLVIGIIFLFLCIAVAPSINSTVVKASNDNDLVAVTSQACGIQGFGNTTVKLTREQYQNLEQYLVDFRARLNQTTTREEAIPIFKDAVVELNKYGLLPKGMSVEKAQKLVTGDYIPKWERKLVANLWKNSLTNDTNESQLCLISGNGDYSIVRLPYIILENAVYVVLGGLIGELMWSIYDNPILILSLLILLMPIYVVFDVCFSYLDFFHAYNPFHTLSTVEIYGNAKVQSLGINGIRHWQGNLRGDIFGSSLNKFIVGYTGYSGDPCYPAIIGFTGISLTIHGKGFIGAALMAKIVNQ